MSIAKRMIKTSIVGFCYGCQQMHFKEEAVRENGVLYCKGSGRLINTQCFEPPEPIEAREEDFYEWAFEGAGTKEPQEPPCLPTRAEQITEHMEGLADLFEIDIQKHQAHWDYLVSQIQALADTKKHKPVKKANKAALGTQLTLLTQEVSE